MCYAGDAGVSIADVIAWAGVVGVWDVERLIRVVKAAESETNKMRSEELDKSKRSSSRASPSRPVRRRR